MPCVSTDIGGISETLFLPLYFRAIETGRADALFEDPLAEMLVAEIDYDFEKLSGDDLLQTTVAMRVHEFDRQVKTYIEEHPWATVVNLGCGLDTRFDRLDNGLITWYECDFPDVISLRKQLLPEGDRHRLVACSVVEDGWLDNLDLSTDHGLLFIAEGLFPYFETTQINGIAQKLRHHFPGAILMFDTLSPLQVDMCQYHPVLKGMDAEIKIGIRSAVDFEDRKNGVRLLWQAFYFSKWLPRLGWLNFLNFLPPIRYGFSVVAYQLS